jgi:hypothetical protein
MGRVDLFHSRRINYDRCEYWVRDERDSTGSPSEWIMRNDKSGVFYARAISPENNQANVVSNVWMLDSNNITLETDDDIHEMTRGCIVKYDNDLWLVQGVQKSIHLKESEFSKHKHYKYIINITKG